LHRTIVPDREGPVGKAVGNVGSAAPVGEPATAADLRSLGADDGVLAQDIPDTCRETWRTPSTILRVGAV
jgi:hypothetical protein